MHCTNKQKETHFSGLRGAQASCRLPLIRLAGGILGHQDLPRPTTIDKAARTELFTLQTNSLKGMCFQGVGRRKAPRRSLDSRSLSNFPRPPSYLFLQRGLSARSAPIVTGFAHHCCSVTLHSTKHVKAQTEVP